jgi:hypothetical protein
MTSMSFNHRVGLSTASNIINETCEALWKTLMPVYLSKPSTDVWKKHANNFQRVTDFPNCVGAVDGKHVVIQAPNTSGSPTIIIKALIVWF